MNIKVKKIIILSILLSMCIGLSIIDSLISGLIISFVPNIKIGLSNIVVLIVIYQYGFKEGIIISLLKSIIVGLLLNGILAFLIGGIASLVSVLLMCLMKKHFGKIASIISISFVGGIIHIITQLAIVSIIYKMYENVLIYGIYLILISIFTSIIIGFLALYVNKIIEKNDLFKNNV